MFREGDSWSKRCTLCQDRLKSCTSLYHGNAVTWWRHDDVSRCPVARWKSACTMIWPTTMRKTSIPAPSTSRWASICCVRGWTTTPASSSCIAGNHTLVHSSVQCYIFCYAAGLMLSLHLHLSSTKLFISSHVPPPISSSNVWLLFLPRPFLSTIVIHSSFLDWQ